MPSQSSSGPAPSMPQAQACGSLVTGRSTPTGENCAPASWLNSDDLPLPVPPASTTIVCCEDSRSRSPARASSASASASRSAPKPSGPTRAEPIWTSRARALSRSDRFAPVARTTGYGELASTAPARRFVPARGPPGPAGPVAAASVSLTARPRAPPQPPGSPRRYRAPSRPRSPRHLQGVGRLVEVQAGGGIRRADGVDHVGEPAHLLIEEQRDAVAQVGPGARHDVPQRARAEQRGEQAARNRGRARVVFAGPEQADDQHRGQRVVVEGHDLGDGSFGDVLRLHEAGHLILPGAHGPGG